MQRTFFRTIFVIALLAQTAAYAQTSPAPQPQKSTDDAVPTIPGSQTAPAPLSSPFQFVSVTTSADDFFIKSNALAQTNSEDAEVKALAQELGAAHEKMMSEVQAAAKEERVDIAKPGVDGEQFRLLSLMEAAKGAEFDRLFLESTLFVHQRTLAYYEGYAAQAGALGVYAKQVLPDVKSRYDRLTALASARGVSAEATGPKSTN